MFDVVYAHEKKPVEIKGFWTATLYGPDGEYKTHVSGQNVITTNGLEYLASYLNSAATSAQNVLKYIAIGTDSTAELASDTALGTELSRHTGTTSYSSGAIFQVIATFAAGSGTGAIVEYGLFSSNAGGTMFSRDTEAVINKGASDTLTVTAEVTFS